MPTDLDRWPGAERRDPPRTSATWVVRAGLARWLRAQAGELAAGPPVRILDVGCGVKPYYPFFAHVARSYVGVDVVENPAAELLGPVEALPVEDGSFDVVLCTQVLEHADDPAQAVRELRRVTAPGGRVLASTHGVQVYHPSPTDYWRWTHTGLERLFARNGEWVQVAVMPVGGAATCIGAMSAVYASAVDKEISAIAFGDLFLEDVRRYREDRLRDTGLEPIFPLWGRNTHELISEMLDGGLRARIVCLDPSKLPADFVGRDLDHHLLRRMPAGVDPCAENGEFHTFAHAGPMFHQPIPIKNGETVMRDGFLFADVLPDSETAAL